MANSKFSDAITIREIEYTIQIKDKDSGFSELHDLLFSELTRFEYTRKKGEKLENPIRDFLQTNIERSIVIRDSTRVYFLDYREHGSFTIQFKLLVITRYLNYGTTRQALDYLIKDTIGEYFEELIERHVPVSVTVHATDHELYEISANQSHFEPVSTRPQRDYLAVILSSAALLVALIAGLFWIFQKNPTTGKNEPAQDYREKYYELLIEKKVMQAFEKEKYDYLIRKSIESATDTVGKLRFDERN